MSEFADLLPDMVSLKFMHTTCAECFMLGQAAFVPLAAKW